MFINKDGVEIYKYMERLREVYGEFGIETFRTAQACFLFEGVAYSSSKTRCYLYEMKKKKVLKITKHRPVNASVRGGATYYLSNWWKITPRGIYTLIKAFADLEVLPEHRKEVAKLILKD